MLTESGKALPVPFTLGLIAGIVDTLGASGGTPSLLDWMIKEIFPRYHDHLPPIDERATYNPLYSYYRSHYGTLAPVDYAYLALLRRGLDVLHGIQAGSGIARRIGHHWWLGEPPIHQYRPLTDTLQYLLTPIILDNIHDARIAYISRIRPLEPGKPTIRLPSEEPLYLLNRRAVRGMSTDPSLVSAPSHWRDRTTGVRYAAAPRPRVMGHGNRSH